MNKDFLYYYNSELDYLRNSAASFAEENPKIAGRLDITSIPCPDPYIERLLEGMAFLSARINYKFESGYPRLSNSLINNLFPQYLNPIPSIALTSFTPDHYNRSLAEGFTIPKGTVLRCRSAKSYNKSKFKTVYDVNLWPVKMTKTEYCNSVPIANITGGESAFSIDLESTAELNFNEIDMNRLDLYFTARDAHASSSLLEMICTSCCNIVFSYKNKSGNPVFYELNDFKNKMIHRGFKREESLFPHNPRTSEGHRILREYCVYPQKFMFLSLTEINDILRQIPSNKLRLYFIFTEKSIPLYYTNSQVTALYCTPVINLFPKVLSRVHLNRKTHEYHIVGERTSPIDFEISDINSVKGYGGESPKETEFYPLYNATGFFQQNYKKKVYYTFNREQRTISGEEAANGIRSKYPGTELYISLVDADAAPYNSSLTELEIKAYCTNRDLPLLALFGTAKNDFSSDTNLPAKGIKCLERPSEPYSDHIFGTIWNAVNYISLNFSTLDREHPEETASNIKEMLKVFSIGNTDISIIEKLKSISINRKLCRCTEEGFQSFINGIQINTAFNEAQKMENGIFILGAVLNHFFSAIAPVNLFIETILSSNSRGLIKKWPVKNGISQMI